MAVISIEGMEFHALIGCFDEEKIIGTRFVVDIFMDYDTSEAEKKDDLTKTINYQAVYCLIKKEMSHKTNLLEHVGRLIIDRVHETFPGIIRIRLKIRKMNPPLGGQMKCVALEFDEKY